MDDIITEREPWTRLEIILANMGLSDPGVRFLSVSVAATTLLFAVRPGYIFLDDGSVNPNSIIPWWLPGITLGTIAALFV